MLIYTQIEVAWLKPNRNTEKNSFADIYPAEEDCYCQLYYNITNHIVQEMAFNVFSSPFLFC